MDSSNALFGTGTTVGVIGPIVLSTASSQTQAGPASPSQPFSMTNVVNLSLDANSSLSLAGFNLKSTSCSGAIGDFVWRDDNNNGIQDSGEVGINGVTVQLYQGSNLIATTVTAPAGYGYNPPGPGGAGYYQFGGLCAGNYSVAVTTPSGYLPSPTGQGTPSTDSNVNPAPVTLTTDTSTDETIDFGFYAPPDRK